MGQYFRAVNADNWECVEPHDYQNGAKIMEHSFVDNNYVSAVEFLLIETENKLGRWARKRIVWAGDYADEYMDITDNKGNKEKTNYFQLSESVNLPLQNLIEKIGKNYKYIINWDKKEYVDKTKGPKINSMGWRFHPLPLLTCDNTEGMYLGDNPHLGSWFKNSISVSDKFPKTFKQLLPNFERDE